MEADVFLSLAVATVDLLQEYVIMVREVIPY